MHACVPTYTHAYAHACLRTRMHTYTHAYAHASTRTRMHTHTHAQEFLRDVNGFIEQRREAGHGILISSAHAYLTLEEVCMHV